MAKSSIDLNAWDAELAGKSANYEKLHNQMLQASKESPGDVEIWSRLTQITYMLLLNLTEEAAVKSKLLEGFEKAEKALSLDTNHFRANLWMAFTAGRLALMSSNLQEKIKYTVPFLRSLEVCTRLNPSEPMVLFLEGLWQYRACQMHQIMMRPLASPTPANDTDDASVTNED